MGCQTWECIDVDNGVSSSDVLYDDIDAEQVEAKRPLKPDSQIPKLISIRLKHWQLQFILINLHTHTLVILTAILQFFCWYDYNPLTSIVAIWVQL